MTVTTAIFLTYSHRPHFDEKNYETFLLEHDNPFFNGIAGIARYENWKLVPPFPAGLGFDYFDLIYLDGTRTLEDVWFDPELTAFRRNWVQLWGYSSNPPPVVNGQGYVLEGSAIPPLDATGRVVLGFLPAGERRTDEWRIKAAMPKHYAFPVGEAPQPWYDEHFERSVLPGERIALGKDTEAGLAAVRIAPS